MCENEVKIDLRIAQNLSIKLAAQNQKSLSSPDALISLTHKKIYPTDCRARVSQRTLPSSCVRHDHQVVAFDLVLMAALTRVRK